MTLTRNWPKAVFANALMRVDSALAFVDTSGTSRGVFRGSGNNTNGEIGFNYAAADAQAANGIVCGTDNTAEDPADFHALALIPQGVTDNTLSYAEQSVITCAFGSDLPKVKVQRFVTNNGSVSITIKEVCLYISIISGYGGLNFYNVCVDRTVLASPITLAAGASQRFEYEITMPVPY